MLHNKVILLLVFPFYCSFLFSQPSNNLYKLSEGLKKEWLKKDKTEVIIQFHDQKMELSSIVLIGIKVRRALLFLKRFRKIPVFPNMPSKNG